MLPIVLIPSQLLTAELWRPQIADWRDREVMVADNASAATIPQIAANLLAAAPERFALAAHGMGGFIAFEVMRQEPRRVARLALLSTLASADGPAQTARRQGYLDLVEAGRFDEVVEERLPLLLSPAGRGDPALVSAARRMALDTGPERFLRQQRALMARIDSRPSLAAIAVPTLLLWGDADGITTRAHQDEMLAAIPDARLQVLPGTGHLMTLEAPEETASALAGLFA
jgi:pimeloyl-ACP methyl ester carboxylesterase